MATSSLLDGFSKGGGGNTDVHWYSIAQFDLRRPLKVNKGQVVGLDTTT